MAHQADDLDPDTLLPTKQSLLARLRDWQDQAGWQRFFDSYWRVVYNVARNAGLSEFAVITDSALTPVVCSSGIWLW